MGYITIDAGTTNTRVRYIEDYKVLSRYEDNIGVKDTAITGKLDKLKASIKNGILTCLKNCGRTLKDVDNIIASGMITSNLGLVEIPHLLAPAGIEDLANSIVIKRFDDIVNKPICFIPGVKNNVKYDLQEELEQIDMMRGEEVECIGVLNLASINENSIFISPGSHTKFVFTNKDKKIVKCITTFTGELLSALSKETVLASSIPKSLITSIDKEYLKKGVDSARRNGFSRACFLVRALDLFTDATGNQLANFIAGAIAYYDIKSIENDFSEEDFNILIGGKKVLRELYKSIFEILGYDKKNIRLLSDYIVENASSIGAIKVIEYYKKGR